MNLENRFWASHTCDEARVHDAVDASLDGDLHSYRDLGPGIPPLRPVRGSTNHRPPLLLAEALTWLGTQQRALVVRDYTTSSADARSRGDASRRVRAPNHLSGMTWMCLRLNSRSGAVCPPPTRSPRKCPSTPDRSSTSASSTRIVTTRRDSVIRDRLDPPQPARRPLLKSRRCPPLATPRQGSLSSKVCAVSTTP